MAGTIDATSGFAGATCGVPPVKSTARRIEFVRRVTEVHHGVEHDRFFPVLPEIAKATGLKHCGFSGSLSSFTWHDWSIGLKTICDS